MLKKHQQTLNEQICFTGIGLHSGKKIEMKILPATPDQGISFLRTDLNNAQLIPANALNISGTNLCTTLGFGENKVSTIEHLLAAFFGLNIDNALVKISGPEVPVMDGSAGCFVEEIKKTGLKKQEEERQCFLVKKPFEIRLKDQYVRIEPYQGLRFDCSIDFPFASIGRQAISLDFSEDCFLSLCRARTFCHVSQVKAMQDSGLALGGSLENAVVVGEEGILNPEGLRYPDEFVRHKLLDAIGDIALLGRPIIGKIILNKSGHALHAEFVKGLFHNKDEFLIISEEKK